MTVARPFARGARPSPRHRLLAAAPHRPVSAPPPQSAMIPPRLSPWDNETDGVCVSSEEAFAKAAWSVLCGLPELFATEQEVRNFAARHGWLNGATLTEVMDVMASEGMPIGGVSYKDGPHYGVDYADETVLKSAIATGPVKIAIDADALPATAGRQQGWYATAGGRFPNPDHCVGLCAYGPADWLYQQLGVPLPPGLPAPTPGYLLFTWGTIGFVTHAWLMGTCVEAWVRSPTTVGQGPAPSPPSPPVPPPPGPPVPPVPPALPAYVGQTQPYSFTLTVPGYRPVRVTIPGQTVTSHPAPGAGRPRVPVLTILADAAAVAGDVATVWADVRAGDIAGAIAGARRVLADGTKLLADLGVTGDS